MIDLYEDSPQLVVLEILNDAIPLFVKLRGYPKGNENPRGRKPHGSMLSLHGHDHLL